MGIAAFQRNTDFIEHRKAQTRHSITVPCLRYVVFRCSVISGAASGRPSMQPEWRMYIECWDDERSVQDEASVCGFAELRSSQISRQNNSALRGQDNRQRPNIP